jgi:hypothetical protein
VTDVCSFESQSRLSRKNNRDEVSPRLRTPANSLNFINTRGLRRRLDLNARTHPGPCQLSNLPRKTAGQSCGLSCDFSGPALSSVFVAHAAELLARSLPCVSRQISRKPDRQRRHRVISRRRSSAREIQKVDKPIREGCQQLAPIPEVAASLALLEFPASLRRTRPWHFY